jgi:hypothetical protein
VLYEMLFDWSLFRGDDITETLAAIIKGQRDLSAAPANARPVLAQCLGRLQRGCKGFQ